MHIWESQSGEAGFFHFVAAIVYAMSWIVLYATSTLYHAARHLERKAYLRILDHCAIFIVIAASYGPYVIHAMGHTLGYTLWALSWVIAISGCVFKFRSEYRYHVQSTWLYLFQGWMVMLAVPSLLEQMSPWAFGWLATGGVFLTGGTYFYIRDDVKYNHGAWHLCVLIGSLGFYLSILAILPQ